MKLRSLDSFESLNNKQQQFIMGGILLPISENACWEDSSSRDSYKRDTGGCSKRADN